MVFDPDANIEFCLDLPFKYRLAIFGSNLAFNNKGVALNSVTVLSKNSRMTGVRSGSVDTSSHAMIEFGAVGGLRRLSRSIVSHTGPSSSD